MSTTLDPAALVGSLNAGDRRALARAISIVEDDREGAHHVVSSAYRLGSDAHVVGVTGSPGAGKSTLTDRLIRLYRGAGRSVGVVAVDPASPFTGGAILGDRIRMQDHVGDPNVFVRSMSSRGHLGGLADATARVVALVDAAGFDPILVETVGVGQSEVEVVETADTSLVVLTPVWGDGVQAAKAGILEIGDIFVVNKADLGGADQVVRDLTQMLEMSPIDEWVPPVVVCSAATGEGVDELGAEIEEHRAALASGRGVDRRRRRLEITVRRAVAARLAAEVHAMPIPPEVIDRVLAREVDPWSVARSLGARSEPSGVAAIPTRPV